MRSSLLIAFANVLNWECRSSVSWTTNGQGCVLSKKPDIHVARDFAGLAEFLRRQIVDEAAIYLPVRSYYEHAAELISLCEQHGIAIRVQTQIYNLRSQDSVALDLEQDTHVAASSTSVRTWPSLIKRVIDFVGSTMALIVLSPLLIAVAILVKFTSAGPIFFRQTRVGLNKRMFNMYKFRTMIPNAEEVQEELMSMNEMSGPVFKIKNDPRVTPLGRFLRKTSIDELPQLINVFQRPDEPRRSASNVAARF